MLGPLKFSYKLNQVVLRLISSLSSVHAIRINLLTKLFSLDSQLPMNQFILRSSLPFWSVT